MTDSTKTGPNTATAARRRAIDPALSEDLRDLTSLYDLNPRCGPACRGGVGTEERALLGYPIRRQSSDWWATLRS